MTFKFLYMHKREVDASWNLGMVNWVIFHRLGRLGGFRGYMTGFWAN